MKTRPIIFSAPMIRAILDGTKTQTRRLVKPQEHAVQWPKCGCSSPFGRPGDGLWCREKWAAHKCYDKRKPSQIPDQVNIEFAAGGDINGRNGIRSGERGKWRSSLYMPKWARRPELDQIITSIRVERLGGISEADVRAEGIRRDRLYKGAPETGGWTCDALATTFPTAVEAYQSLWTSIHGPGSWERDRDKWVWVLEFKKGN